MRKSLNSENSRAAGSQGLRIASRIVTYLTIGSLFCACIILSVLLKGAKQAHHELWEELLEQEKKTANAYQDVAADKVIVVDAEEKANGALRDLSICRQDLEWSKSETNDAKERVSVLEKEQEGWIIKEKECEGVRKQISLELDQARGTNQAFQERAGKAIEMIDNVVEQERDVGSVLHPRRTRKRKKRSPEATDMTKEQDDGLEDFQQITYN